MMRRSLILLFGVTFACGCATPYQSSGLCGGYSETQLAPDVFRISFRGNGYTSGERAQNLALLRAAEVTLDHGYKYFILVDESNSQSLSTVTTPGSSYTTGSAYIHGNQATYSGHTTYTPPQTYTVSKPKTGLLIQCLKEPPEVARAFNAAFLVESLKAKYNLK